MLRVLLAMKDDSIKGIYETLADCATVSSQHAGGLVSIFIIFVPQTRL